jgi:ribosome-associated protein
LSTNDTSTEPTNETSDTPSLPGWQVAAWAAEDRKAANIRVLDLTEVTTFADTFVICTASNSRQAQAITDAIQQALKEQGERAISIEGYEQGEWILSDYADLIVHVFSEKAREFYDLDRLWRQAKQIEVPAHANRREELPFRMNSASIPAPDA